MLKHNLTPDDIEGLGGDRTQESYEKGFFRVGEDRTPGLQWRLNLIYVLAQYNFCAFIRYGVHGGSGVIVGQPSNMGAVKEMYEATVETIERLAEPEWFFMKTDLERMARAGYPKAAAWKNSFKLGFPDGLRQKLYLERVNQLKEMENGQALMVVKDHEIAEAVKEKVGETTGSKSSQPTNFDGYQRGVEKGRAHELRERLG